MAKPDTEDGWIPYAHELDAALAAADFTKGARIVLREVFSQTFGIGPVGKTRPQPAGISPSDVAQRWGLDKREVVRSLNHLVACHVLKRSGRGLYAFLKDYERWIWPDGSPRLSKAELSECANVRRLAKARKAAQAQAQNLGVRTVPNGEPLGVRTVPGWGYELSPAGGMNCPQESSPPPDPPNGNGRAELETGRGLEGIVLPDNTGAAGGTKNIHPVSIRDLIAEAKSLHGEDVARQVMASSQEILGTFGDDRLDCYLAAIREAVDATEVIRKPHRWFLRVGKRHLAGAVDPPAQIVPRPSKAAARSKLQDDAIARAVASLPDPEGD